MIYTNLTEEQIFKLNNLNVWDYYLASDSFKLLKVNSTWKIIDLDKVDRIKVFQNQTDIRVKTNLQTNIIVNW